MLTSSWLQDRCKELTEQNKTIWVAYSGGVDSHVLLHLAAAAVKQLCAIHINDNLSCNSNAWQQHCVQVCADLNVPLQCIQVNAMPQRKQSPEDAARMARRKAWQDLLTVDDVLLVAHHAEDQAETILYRLFRGTGPKGFSGMQMRSKIGAALMFRPLLSTSKAAILDYAQHQQLVWVTDETNSNLNYDRNFIRNQVLSLLKTRWPQVSNNINRAGDLCGQLLSFVDPVLTEQLRSICDNNNIIALPKWRSFSDLLRSELLRAWLQQHGVTPSFKQLRLIQQQVVAAKIDANPKFILGNKMLRRSKDKLYIVDHAMPSYRSSNNFTCNWDLQAPLKLPCGKLLLPEDITRLPAVITKLQQHAVVVKLGAHGRKAKKIFQKHAIPPWERDRYPVLFADERLVAIAGLWVSTIFN